MLFSNTIPLNLLAISAVLIALAKLVLDRRRSRFAMLRGPPSNSFFFGTLGDFLDNPATAVDRWVSEYGYVFKVPTGLGTNRIVITDPKALAHVYANDSFGYRKSSSTNSFARTFFGHSMLSADGEDHRRQRRATAPAFTNGALRDTMDVFYSSAYKLKVCWDGLFESHDEAVIDIQPWINKVTLDSIGIAGFGHDFGSLDGHKSPVSEALDVLVQDNSFRFVFRWAPFFPQVFKLPLKQTRIFRVMKKTFADIAKVLLEKSQQEKEALNVEKDRSILGLLLKGRSQNTNFKLVQDEAAGHIVCCFQLIFSYLPSTGYQGLFLFAGYDTTAISISWAIVELARHPEKQDKLRRELQQFSKSDPTWDQVITGTACPYLDAVVHESLRLHPPVELIFRIANKDDVIPLSFPMKTPSGEMVDSIVVPKGTTVATPFVHMNLSEAFWGPNAKRFVPERWLEENPYPSKDFSGYKHLYTFSDGPRICLGRMFALAEFKAVLSVLFRNFTFELPSGPNTPIGTYKVFVPRPKLADEAGCVLRMRVRQVTGQGESSWNTPQ